MNIKYDFTRTCTFFLRAYVSTDGFPIFFALLSMDHASMLLLYFFCSLRLLVWLGIVAVCLHRFVPAPAGRLILMTLWAPVLILYRTLLLLPAHCQHILVLVYMYEHDIFVYYILVS